MENRSKLRILYLYQYLVQNTTPEHPQSTAELTKMLSDKYGIDVSRNTISDDLAMLCSAQFHIKMIRSTQNKYYYDGQAFDIPEMKLLIDAVSSSRFITERKSEALVNKLLSLVQPDDAIKLRRHVYASDRVKSENECGYLIVDVYTPFQQVGLTNVDAAKFSFDPHPNQKGHNMIADLVKQALGLSVMPSIDPDDSIKKIKTVLNGKTRIFEQKSLRINDQYNYVSADEFAEIIGAKIIISKNLQTVVITKGTEKLEGKIGEKRAKINGNTVTLSMPIKFQDTHLLVPIEGLTKTFGGSYKYDQQTNTLKVRIEL